MEEYSKGKATRSVRLRYVNWCFKKRQQRLGYVGHVSLDLVQFLLEIEFDMDVVDVPCRGSSIILLPIVEICRSGLWTSRSPSLVSNFFHLLSRTQTRKLGLVQKTR